MEVNQSVKKDLREFLWQNNYQAQKTILDSLIEHVVIHDMNFNVLWANRSACDSVGLALEQIVGRFCYEIWPKRSIPCDDCPVALSRKTGIPQSIEKKTPDGRCWQISGSPVFDNKGRIIAMVELTLDITQRVNAEEALKSVQFDQEKLIEKRTLALSELNQKLKIEIEDRKKTEFVLNRQKDHIQQLAMELSKAEDRERQRLARVLHGDFQQMLAYLKIKFSALKLRETEENKKEIDTINDHIDSCIEHCRNLSHELKPFVFQKKGFISAIKWVCRQMKEHYGLDVSLQASEEPNIQSSVYLSLLLRSIRELLFNVVKHSGVRKAFIQLKVKDRYLIITIKDTGMGCSPEVLQAKRQNNATFGLFDIEDRINFLGGYMDVESEAGQGFCVTLWVPRDVHYSSEIDRPVILVDNIPDIRTEHDNDKPSFVLSLKRPIRILLTDDHAIMRDGLAELIDGHADIKVVGMAANGREAVELAEKLRPEVILMDVSMPVMNGIEATRQIKEVFPKMIIIGLTMHKDPDIHQAMKKVGASACISKSGSLENLVDSIRSLYSDRQ